MCRRPLPWSTVRELGALVVERSRVRLLACSSAVRLGVRTTEAGVEDAFTGPMKSFDWGGRGGRRIVGSRLALAPVAARRRSRGARVRRCGPGFGAGRLLAGEEVGGRLGCRLARSTAAGWSSGSLLGVVAARWSLLGVSLSGCRCRGGRSRGRRCVGVSLPEVVVARGRRVVVRRLRPGRRIRRRSSCPPRRCPEPVSVAAGQGGVAARGRSTGTAAVSGRPPSWAASSGQYRVRRGGPARAAGIGAAGGPVSGQHVAGVDQAADEVRRVGPRARPRPAPARRRPAGRRRRPAPPAAAGGRGRAGPGRRRPGRPAGWSPTAVISRAAFGPPSLFQGRARRSQLVASPGRRRRSSGPARRRPRGRRRPWPRRARLSRPDAPARTRPARPAAPPRPAGGRTWASSQRTAVRLRRAGVDGGQLGYRRRAGGTGSAAGAGCRGAGRSRGSGSASSGRTAPPRPPASRPARGRTRRSPRTDWSGRIRPAPRASSSASSARRADRSRGRPHSGSSTRTLTSVAEPHPDLRSHASRRGLPGTSYRPGRCAATVSAGDVVPA